jgi:hypothetical protein
MSSKSITIAGTVHSIGEIKTHGANFQKRELVVLVEDGKYQQFIPVEFTGDRTGLVDGYQYGHAISIEANLRGREWRSPSGEIRTFLSLSAWKLNESAKPAQSRGGSHDPAPAPPSNDDPIPF